MNRAVMAVCGVAAVAVVALTAASCGGQSGTGRPAHGGSVDGVGSLDVSYGQAEVPGASQGGGDCDGGACGAGNEVGGGPCTEPTEWTCEDAFTLVLCQDGLLVTEPCGTGEMCADGECVATCPPGRANCSGNPTDGCNVNTTSDPMHCGNCLISCGEGSDCVDSSCVCASTSETATQTPLDIYVMMDQSTSMDQATGTGQSKWNAIAAALDAFVASPASDGIGIGIQYFPIVGSSGGESCAVADYSKPEVAIKPLPGNAGAIKASIGKHSPSGHTPTYPALDGAVSLATTFAKANPTHTVVVVLATDGEPTECDPQDIASIAKVAQKAAAGTPRVMTFVVGVGKSLTNLDDIASAGGTTKAFLVDQGGNVVQQFQDALKAIEGQALGCTYAIPTPSNGQSVDFNKVNVRVTHAGGQPAMLAYFDALASCDATTGGWYYDDPANPNKIMLCPATCAALTGDPTAEVDVLLGCGRPSMPPVQ